MLRCELKEKVSGKTWDVYLYILTSRDPVGIRDVWRSLKLSTPSLAQYHVNKLVEMGLVEQTRDGKYVVEEMIQAGLLRGFILLRGRLVPRLVFYAAFTLGLLASYLILWPFSWDFRDLVVLSISLMSTAAFLVEGYVLMKGLKGGLEESEGSKDSATG